MTIKRALWHTLRYFFAAQLFLTVANAFMWPGALLLATLIAIGGGIASLPTATLIEWSVQRTQWRLATKFLAILTGITANTILFTGTTIAIVFNEYNMSPCIAPALCTVAAICFCFKKL